MPKPKVENAQKISLNLPAEVTKRLKIEAVERQTIEAFIVRDALLLYWKLQEAKRHLESVAEQSKAGKHLHELDFRGPYSLSEKLEILEALHRSEKGGQA